MLETIIKAVVLAIVLYVVYILVGMVVAALGLPAILSLVVGVILVLGFLLWLLKAFGINFWKEVTNKYD